MSVDVLNGAEPFSTTGSDVGVLLVHGFTGSPSSLRAMALAAADAGYTVELPRVPGHGTTTDDLESTGWDDWSTAVELSLLDLRTRVDQVVCVGLSAGGAWLVSAVATHRTVAGMMFVNPLFAPIPAALMDQVRDALDSGVTLAPGDGPDIAREGHDEVSYNATPLVALLELQRGLVALQPLLSSIDVPVLLATSLEDHVIDISNSDHFVEHSRSTVRRIQLENSFHVATQDHDQPLLIDEMLRFIKEVTS